MNILIGKYGQKVIFDRSSKECQRSNTNGNVGLYKMMKLMFDHNKNDRFLLISNNIGGEDFDNVVDFSNNDLRSLNVLHNFNLDVMVIIAGLGEYEKDERLIEMINGAKVKKFILISEDPRCIESMNNDKRLTRIPDVIIAQTTGKYNFKGKEVDIVYVPIQTACCYEEEMSSQYGTNTNMLLIANTSGDKYNRPKIASQLLKNSRIKYDVYGRLSEDDLRLLSDGNYKGEVKYDEMQKVLREAFYTLLIPIDKDWCTSKYVEALMNYTLPIFYIDYNIDLLNMPLLHKYTVTSQNELKKLVDWCTKDERSIKEVYNDIGYLRDDLVKPYIDGRLLNAYLMNAIK